MSGLAALGWLVVFLICVAIYFIPSMVAGGSKHHNAGAIFALNLFLGWTLLGWVVALIWALTTPAAPAAAAQPVAGAVRTCPQCHASVLAAFGHCPHCGAVLVPPAPTPPSSPPVAQSAIPAIAPVTAPPRRMSPQKWAVAGVLVASFTLLTVVSLVWQPTRRAPRANPAPIPMYSTVHHQGIVFMVFVAPDVAASERDLWVIAEDIRETFKPKENAAQVMFWTHLEDVPQRLPMSDVALRTQVAQINLNPLTGLREIRALNGHQFRK